MRLTIFELVQSGTVFSTIIKASGLPLAYTSYGALETYHKRVTVTDKSPLAFIFQNTQVDINNDDGRMLVYEGNSGCNYASNITCLSVIQIDARVGRNDRTATISEVSDLPVRIFALRSILSVFFRVGCNLQHRETKKPQPLDCNTWTVLVSLKKIGNAVIGLVLRYSVTTPRHDGAKPIFYLTLLPPLTCRARLLHFLLWR